MKQIIIILPLLAAAALFSRKILVHLYLRLAVGRTTFCLRALGKALTGKGAKNPAEENVGKEDYWLHGQNIEKVRIRSRDNYVLTGHYLEHPKAERIVLMFHGWRGRWDTDGDAMAKGLYGKKCSILLVDQRAHEMSGGPYIGFGVLERYDCLDWIEYAKQRIHSLPIYLSGVSMGASTVLMASGMTLPNRVKGVIADCGFTSPYEMVKIFAKKFMKMKNLSMVDDVNQLCRKKAGYDLKEYSTLEAMKSCRVPVFFAHGTKDNFVPMEMSLENYKACGSRKTLYIAEGAAHTGSYSADPERYLKEVSHFFQWL